MRQKSRAYILLTDAAAAVFEAAVAVAVAVVAVAAVAVAQMSPCC